MDPSFIFAGCLRRDTILPPTGRPLIDAPGGNLLYAAAGLAVWENDLGLLGRVGEDYPHEWLKSFEKRGWDTRGIRILPEPVDLRFFLAYTDLQTAQQANPVAHFARLGLTFPKSLLGYQPAREQQDGKTETLPASPRPVDIPAVYLDARAVHLCPMDYLTHSRLVPAFQQAHMMTLSLDPGAGYMEPGQWNNIRTMLHGLTVFLPSEEELRRLFWGRTDDLWDMAEGVASFGCELVVIKRGGRGQLLYDSTSRKRWEIPAYPARLADLTGAGDSFCGGFLAGLRKTYDPLQAALQGNVSASLAVEGSGAFHVLDTLPGLPQARMDALKDVVRAV